MSNTQAISTEWGLESNTWKGGQAKSHWREYDMDIFF
jgi:hypothetical protein